MLFVIEFILESQMILNNAFDVIRIIDEGVENAIIGVHKKIVLFETYCKPFNAMQKELR